MAASKTAICQRALARLGCTTNISDVDTDTSQEAKLCRIFYDAALATVFQDYDWPFAKRSVGVALIETDLTGRWLSHYAYPSDAVRILCLYPADLVTAPAFPSYYNQDYSQFEILGSDTGKIIGTFYDVALTCEYIKLETNTALYPASFEDALVYRIAMDLALGLNKSAEMAKMMNNAYISIVAVAKCNQKNEDNYRYSPKVITDRFL